jgi:monoamine oxidase
VSDFVVIGAGISGLAAACRLRDAGAEVVVLEARDRVGGRLESAWPREGVWLDLGGTWVGPSQTRVIELAAEYGVETFPQFDEGARLLELEGRVRRYKGTIPRIGPLTLLDLARMQFGFGRLAKQVASLEPGAPRAAEIDALSVEDWLTGRRHGERAKQLLGIAGKTIWGAEPRELSLLYAAHYVNGAGGLDALLDTEGGAQHWRLTGGAQELALRLAGALGERVRLAHPVQRIDVGADAVIASGPAGEFAAGQAIVALPPPLCEQIEFSPDLPAARSTIQRGTRMGALTKCFALYDEPFWREQNLSGEALSTTGPATLTFDVSPPDASCGVLLAFVGADEARQIDRLSESDARSAVLAGVARLFGERALEPEEWTMRNWVREPFSGGGPVAIAPPGVLTSAGGPPAAPWGRIHWAGTEAAPRWGGYIEGAILAGEHAAAAALAEA